VEFLSAVWALYRELDSASARMLEHLGVSGPQRLALRIIELTPGISAGELALALDLHRSTVSGLAKRLEHLGLLTRRTDTSDRRVVFLELTAAGRKLNTRTALTIETALGELIQARGAAWRRSARELLRDLSAAIHSAGDRSRGHTPARER
jgi:DNA-binding MarR family transcriptional regulator